MSDCLSFAHYLKVKWQMGNFETDQIIIFSFIEKSFKLNILLYVLFNFFSFFQFILITLFKLIHLIIAFLFHQAGFYKSEQ